MDWENHFRVASGKKPRKRVSFGQDPPDVNINPADIPHMQVDKHSTPIQPSPDPNQPDPTSLSFWQKIAQSGMTPHLPNLFGTPPAPNQLSDQTIMFYFAVAAMLGIGLILAIKNAGVVAAGARKAAPLLLV
jgi:hypothetical protein